MNEFEYYHYVHFMRALELRKKGLALDLPEDVMRAKQCSYPKACEYLRQILGRQPGERGLLRSRWNGWSSGPADDHRPVAPRKH
jgi:hypothetical protein